MWIMGRYSYWNDFIWRFTISAGTSGQPSRTPWRSALRFYWYCRWDIVTRSNHDKAYILPNRDFNGHPRSTGHKLVLDSGGNYKSTSSNKTVFNFQGNSSQAQRWKMGIFLHQNFCFFYTKIFSFFYTNFFTPIFLHQNFCFFTPRFLFFYTKIFVFLHQFKPHFEI